MKNILLNSEQVTCKAKNLTELLVEKGYADAIIATALNGEFIAKENRQTTQIQNGDRVEVLAPMQGG